MTFLGLGLLAAPMSAMAETYVEPKGAVVHTHPRYEHPTHDTRIDVGRAKGKTPALTLRGWRTSTNMTALRVILQRPTMSGRR